MTIIKIFQGKNSDGSPKQVGGAFTLAAALEKCRRWAYVKPGTRPNRVSDGRIGHGRGATFTYVIEAAARMLDEQNRANHGGRLSAPAVDTQDRNQELHDRIAEGDGSDG